VLFLDPFLAPLQLQKCRVEPFLVQLPKVLFLDPFLAPLQLPKVSFWSPFWSNSQKCCF
jgi:hypothetical protein